jgi:hypothetical protein
LESGGRRIINSRPAQATWQDTEVFPALFITAREWKQSKCPLTDEWRNKIGNMLSKRNQSKTNKRHWQSGSSSRAPA